MKNISTITSLAALDKTTICSIDNIGQTLDRHLPYPKNNYYIYFCLMYKTIIKGKTKAEEEIGRKHKIEYTRPPKMTSQILNLLYQGR